MRRQLQELYNKINGRTVFVIGGGVSIENLDTSLLHDKIIICINNSCQLFPNCTAIFWADQSWADNNHKLLQKHACKLRFTPRPSITHYIKNDIDSTYGSCVLKKTGNYGFDNDVNNIRGNNSGANVIHLCANLGAKNIILLGFDMKTTKNRSNYHDSHICQATDAIYNSFNESICSIVSEIKNVNIINCTKNSKLTCVINDDLTNWI